MQQLQITEADICPCQVGLKVLNVKQWCGVFNRSKIIWLARPGSIKDSGKLWIFYSHRVPKYPVVGYIHDTLLIFTTDSSTLNMTTGSIYFVQQMLKSSMLICIQSNC